MAEQVLVRLHGMSEAAAIRPAIELAYLIVALDSGNDTTAQVVAARYRDSIEEAATDPKSENWLAAMPDVVDRIDRLVADADAATFDDDADPFLADAGSDPAAPAPKPADRSKVLGLLDKAIERNPNSAPLYLNRGRLRFARQQYEAALADVTRAIELAPDVEAYKFRAILHMILADASAAVADLTEAIALDGDDPDLLRMRAAAHRRAGDDAKADADMEAAKRLEPAT